eukprot:TRINITY_DN1277_c0_g1_i1.p1 TRINITY_DN1277_c0_g1~~TRINITY_DN1277_c0_g1_i1.p1  ORF type:complete len:149 (+),score=64.69 TRINITY_DN1277_c0_g1_i1:134-580(+)
MGDLGPEQIQELKEAFKMFDVDKQGAITKSSLKRIMTQLGVAATDEDVDKMIEEADGRGTGKVEFNSFVSMFSRRLKKMDTADDIALAFSCYDTSGKGYLSKEDMTKVLQETGKLNDKEIREFLTLCEPNEDGQIDYEKMARKMTTKQ